MLEPEAGVAGGIVGRTECGWRYSIQEGVLQGVLEAERVLQGVFEARAGVARSIGGRSRCCRGYCMPDRAMHGVLEAEGSIAWGIGGRTECRRGCWKQERVLQGFWREEGMLQRCCWKGRVSQGILGARAGAAGV